MAEAEGPLNLDPAFLAEDRSGVLQGIAISFAIITSVMMLLRFFAKARFQAPGIELFDIFLVAAYIITLGMCAIGITMTVLGGVGRHVALFEQRGGDKAKLRGWAQCILAFEIVYFTSVALPKIAIIFMYIRVFNWRDTRRRMAWALILLNAALATALVLAACFQCIPIAYWWDRTIPGGKCFDIQAFFHAQAIPGFVLDLLIMALPLKSIWDLKLPPIKKIALAFIFLIASFGMVASIIRATIFFGTSAFADRTWASVELVGWSIIESGTYIVTACLPHMKPILSHYTPQSVKDFTRGLFSRATSAISGANKSISTGTTGKRSRRRGDLDIHKNGDDIDHVEPVRLDSLDEIRTPPPPAPHHVGSGDDDKKPFWAAEPRGPHESIYGFNQVTGAGSSHQLQQSRVAISSVPDNRSWLAGGDSGNDTSLPRMSGRTSSGGSAGSQDVVVTTRVTVTSDYYAGRSRTDGGSDGSWPLRSM